MRLLILGGTGMLGHKLFQCFRNRFDTFVTFHGSSSMYLRRGLFDPDHAIFGVDARDLDTIVGALAATNADVVVNAIGIVKQLPEANDPIVSLTINSLFPHRMAALCQATGARLIHISTDCVFTGKKGGYTEDDVSDAEDLYGRTKFLGEMAETGGLTIRTSIIGRELASANGLVEWLLSNRGRTVQGYTEAIFSGLTTNLLAELMANIIENYADLSGLYHVSAEAISKYDLLTLIRDAYGIPLQIDPIPGPRCDRSLDSSRFRRATGFVPPPWTEMIRNMAADPTPYDEWRERSGS